MPPQTVTIVRHASSPYGATRSISTLVPFSDVREFAAAGDVAIREQAPGSYTFSMAAQAFRTEPRVDGAGFPARFAAALASLMPRGVQATARVAGVSSGPVFDPPGMGAVDPVDAQGPTWWVTVTGTVQASDRWAVGGASGLNRVIARALAQSMTLGPTTPPAILGGVNMTTFASRFSGYRPADGGQLQVMLDDSGACGSHQNWHQMWLKACTAIQRVGSAPAPSTLPTAPTPSVPAAPPGPEASMVPAPAASGCKVVIQSQAWLRPTQTFNHDGPVLPVGTALDVLGRTSQTHLTYRLYQVRVAPGASASLVGQTGYVALDAGDVATAQPANCAGTISAPTPAPTPPAPHETTPTAPSAADVAARAASTVNKAAEFPVGLAVGTAVVVGGVGTAIALALRKKKRRG